MGTKVLSNQRVTVLAGLASGISDWDNPVLSEMLALTNISGAINWNTFDFNVKASDQKDDRTLTDGAGAQSRGFANFGGNIQGVYPRPDDLSSIFRTAYDILSTPRVELVIAVRYGKLNSSAPVAGDKWNIFHVESDPVFFGENDVSKFYQVTLVSKNDILPEYIVPASSATAVTITALDASVSVGDLIFVSAAYEGWDITKAAEWIISDQTKVELLAPGIFKALAAGTPTIKGRYPGGTDSSTATITITA